MEPSLTLREYAAVHAPISLTDVTAILPNFDLSIPGDRAAAMVVLARMRVEYADALIAELNGQSADGE